MPSETVDMEEMHLVLSDHVLVTAHVILERERVLLLPLLPEHLLVLTGGSSLPGVLTRGDVDLHVRVAEKDFASTVNVLRKLHEVVHPEIWQSDLATFGVDALLPTGVAVTPIGSVHDVLFTRTWQILADDSAELTGYNEMKASADAVSYERRKNEFFDGLVARHPVSDLDANAT